MPEQAFRCQTSHSLPAARWGTCAGSLCCQCCCQCQPGCLQCAAVLQLAGYMYVGLQTSSVECRQRSRVHTRNTELGACHLLPVKVTLCDRDINIWWTG